MNAASSERGCRCAGLVATVGRVAQRRHADSWPGARRSLASTRLPSTPELAGAAQLLQLARMRQAREARLGPNGRSRQPSSVRRRTASGGPAHCSSASACFRSARPAAPAARAELGLRALAGRLVVALPRHAVGEIVLAGEPVRRVVVVGVVLAVAELLHQPGRRVADVERRRQRAVLLGRALGGAL